jgi:hypothetical protein
MEGLWQLKNFKILIKFQCSPTQEGRVWKDGFVFINCFDFRYEDSSVSIDLES